MHRTGIQQRANVPTRYVAERERKLSVELRSRIRAYRDALRDKDSLAKRPHLTTLPARKARLARLAGPEVVLIVEVHWRDLHATMRLVQEWLSERVATYGLAYGGRRVLLDDDTTDDEDGEMIVAARNAKRPRVPPGSNEGREAKRPHPQDGTWHKGECDATRRGDHADATYVPTSPLYSPTSPQYEPPESPVEAAARGTKRERSRVPVVQAMPLPMGTVLQNPIVVTPWGAALVPPVLNHNDSDNDYDDAPIRKRATLREQREALATKARQKEVREAMQVKDGLIAALTVQMEEAGEDARQFQAEKLAAERRIVQLESDLRTAQQERDADARVRVAEEGRLQRTLELERRELAAYTDAARCGYQNLLSVCCVTCNAGCSVKNPPTLPDRAANEPPVVAQCANGHGQCNACLRHYCAAFCNVDTELTCIECTLPECDAVISDEVIGAALELSSYAEYINVKSQRRAAAETAAALERERADKSLPTQINTAAEMKTPCCGLLMWNFDGCTAIRCSNLNTCNKYFCGWCFQVFDTSREAHLHISEGRCAECPDRDFYMLTEEKRSKLRATWKAQQVKQLSASLGVTLTVAQAEELQGKLGFDWVDPLR